MKMISDNSIMYKISRYFFMNAFHRSLKACGRVSLEPGDDGNKFFGAEKYRLEVAECMRHTKYSSSESRLSSCLCVNSGMYSVQCTVSGVLGMPGIFDTHFIDYFP